MRAQWNPFVRTGNIQGISTLDVVISVFVVSLLVGIFVPGALRQGILCNEAVALNGLRALATTNLSYFAHEDLPAFPDSFDTIREAGVYLLPLGVEKGQIGNYNFSLKVGAEEEPRTGFSAEAHPSRYRWDGVRSFFVDETNRFRGEDIGGFPGNASMELLSSHNEEKVR